MEFVVWCIVDSIVNDDVAEKIKINSDGCDDRNVLSEDNSSYIVEEQLTSIGIAAL